MDWILWEVLLLPMCSFCTISPCFQCLYPHPASIRDSTREPSFYSLPVASYGNLSKFSLLKTTGMTTCSLYINMLLYVENILFVLHFWFINSFLVWLMNLSNFVLNFISFSVTRSSLIVLNKTYFTSISDLNEAMTVFPSGSVFFGINLGNPSACAISFDGKNSLLNE